ncbi:MAG: AAA family ATPase [Methylococcales bacterium]
MPNNSTNANGAPCSGVRLINALCDPSVYAHEVIEVSLIETHISWVLLTGKYAYKIKKPVNFGFLDFSTLQKRHFYCQEELRLNRRLAANLYLEVVPITGQPDHPIIGGAGEIIEYAVKMHEFPEGFTLNERASAGQLRIDEMDQIVGIVADFHETIERADKTSSYGGCAEIKHWFVNNFEQIRPLLADDYDKQQLQAIQTWGNDEWHKQSGLMQQRKQQGYVRECHGDLHLGNMTLISGQVVLFDCIEFNPMLRWIDVISEVAFLFMDLLYFGYEHYAYRFLNQYLQRSGDYSGLAVFKYYLVYRALVRAKVSLLRLAQLADDIAVCKNARFAYSKYVNLAERYIKVSQPVLIITHGFSGSGKSAFACQLAEKIGALQIRSDIERKRLFGLLAEEQSNSAINKGLYTQEVGLKTYQRLAELAKSTLDAGFSVIIDATFLKVDQRKLFQLLAEKEAVRFFIMDVQAANTTLCQRVLQRKNDASEATIEVLQQQQQSAQPLSDKEQPFVITVNSESSYALEAVVEKLAV